VSHLNQIPGWYWCPIWPPEPGTTLVLFQHHTTLWHVLTVCSSSEPSMSALLGTCPNKAAPSRWNQRTVEDWQKTQPGSQIHYDVPTLSQRAATKDKSRVIKRKTAIQRFCLRWDTCYWIDMTERKEIREDAQENGLLLRVCRAELLLLTQLPPPPHFTVTQILSCRYTQACMIAYTHTHTHTHLMQQVHLRHHWRSEAWVKVFFTSPLVLNQ